MEILLHTLLLLLQGCW